MTEKGTPEGVPFFLCPTALNVEYAEGKRGRSKPVKFDKYAIVAEGCGSQTLSFRNCVPLRKPVNVILDNSYFFGGVYSEDEYPHDYVYYPYTDGRVTAATSSSRKGFVAFDHAFGLKRYRVILVSTALENERCAFLNLGQLVHCERTGEWFAFDYANGEQQEAVDALLEIGGDVAARYAAGTIAIQQNVLNLGDKSVRKAQITLPPAIAQYPESMDVVYQKMVAAGNRDSALLGQYYHRRAAENALARDARNVTEAQTFVEQLRLLANDYVVRVAPSWQTLWAFCYRKPAQWQNYLNGQDRGDAAAYALKASFSPYCFALCVSMAGNRDRPVYSAGNIAGIANLSSFMHRAQNGHPHLFADHQQTYCLGREGNAEATRLYQNGKIRDAVVLAEAVVSTITYNVPWHNEERWRVKLAESENTAVEAFTAVGGFAAPSNIAVLEAPQWPCLNLR